MKDFWGHGESTVVLSFKRHGSSTDLWFNSWITSSAAAAVVKAKHP